MTRWLTRLVAFAPVALGAGVCRVRRLAARTREHVDPHRRHRRADGRAGADRPRRNAGRRGSRQTDVHQRCRPQRECGVHCARRRSRPTPFACCVDVGYEASNTRANAEETRDWIERRKVKSLRLVTTDWHMPRARFELDRVIGGDVRIVADAVESDADLNVLVREYNKYLLRRVAVLGGW